MVTLIPCSALKLIRDDGNILYNCIRTQDYKECQDDILAASKMAEDIRDALLDYQVGVGVACMTVGTLKLEHFHRKLSNGQYISRIVGKLWVVNPMY